MESKTELPKYGDFNDPTRCDMCRESITEHDQAAGLVLHVKVAPVKALDPQTGQVMGFVQPEGPANRYFHARPCAERYAAGKLVCDLCNYWQVSKKGAGLCLCVCHPPRKAKVCSYLDNDLERAEGK